MVKRTREVDGRGLRQPASHVRLVRKTCQRGLPLRLLRAALMNDLPAGFHSPGCVGV